jgi:hypothetical protein
MRYVISLSRSIGVFFVVVSMLAAIYDIPIDLGVIVLPNVFAFALLLFFIRTGKQMLEFVGLASIWFLATIFLSVTSAAVFTNEVLLRFMFQLLFSIFIFTRIRSEIGSISKDVVYKTATFLLGILILVGLLEMTTFFSSWVVEVSRALYSKESGYRFSTDITSLERDISLSGRRRVTGLTAESSLYAVAVSFLCIIRFMTDKSKRLLQNIIIISVSYYLARSPFSIVGILVLVAHANVSLRSMRTIAVAVIGLTVVALNMDYLLFRLSYLSLDFSYLTSEALRFLLPFQIFKLVFWESFFTGLSPMGLYDPNLILELTKGYSSRVGDNAFFLIFISYGFILAPLLIYFTFLKSVLLTNDFKTKLNALLFMFFVLMSVGTFVGPKIWVMIGLYLGCLPTVKR